MQLNLLVDPARGGEFDRGAVPGVCIEILFVKELPKESAQLQKLVLALLVYVCGPLGWSNCRGCRRRCL